MLRIICLVISLVLDSLPFQAQAATPDQAFYKGKTVKSVMADGKVYEIAPILMVGLLTGNTWIRLPPAQVFSIFLSKDRGA